LGEIACELTFCVKRDLYIPSGRSAHAGADFEPGGNEGWTA
jgi:hypothetical protein